MSQAPMLSVQDLSVAFKVVGITDILVWRQAVILA